MTEKAIEWLGRHGDRAVLHAHLLRPAPPAPAQPGRVPRPVLGRAGRPVHRLRRPGGGGGLPSPQRPPASTCRPAAAPHDEGERRQLRATYYGAQSEVDDQLGRLFGYLDAQGLASSTLVVLTSDHGEMGGDHWLVEKCGYWDESFHVPLIVRDPSAGRRRHPGAGRRRAHRVGRCGRRPSWTGWAARSRCSSTAGRSAPSCTPVRRRRTGGRRPTGNGTSAIPSTAMPSGAWASPASTAPWRWPAAPRPSTSSSRPARTCCRPCCSTWWPTPATWSTWPCPRARPGAAAPGAGATPGGRHDVRLELEMAQEMLRWRMRNMERTLANCYLAPGTGPVRARDEWR